MTGPGWSLSLGCWGGVHVRMHVSLPVAVLCALLWGSIGRYPSSNITPPKNQPSATTSRPVAQAPSLEHTIPTDRVLVIILLGLAAVGVHAAGHLWAASRQGIENREIVLAPWGELNALQTPPTTEAALNMHLSGIMANAFVCALSAMTLWLAHDFKISDLLNPLGSHYLLQGENHVVTLRWAFWLNYLLILVNLLPAYPFDMHRMIQSAMHLFAPHHDETITYDACVIWGRCFSFVLLLLSPVAAQYPQTDLLPAWFMLASLGMIGLFATNVRPLNIPPVAETQVVEEPVAVEEQPETPRDFAAHAEFDGQGPFAQWLQERRENSRKTRQELEQKEERRVDEILAVLHEQGIDALSPEDRTLLERVSARIRRRMKRSS
jgi:stage IV sporulation protein FB